MKGLRRPDGHVGWRKSPDDHVRSRRDGRCIQTVKLSIDRVNAGQHHSLVSGSSPGHPIDLIPVQGDSLLIPLPDAYKLKARITLLRPHNQEPYYLSFRVQIMALQLTI